MEDDDPPSTSTSSESPPEAKMKEPSSSRKRKSSRRDRKMEVEESEKESQTQYCKGFFDALRVVQSSNQFKFEGGAVSPVLPALTPTFNAITPASASDMHTIVMSILGNTPITNASNTIPPLSSPTNLLPLVTGDMQMDDLSMKLLASSALPGPPIISSSNSPDSSSSAIIQNNQPLPQINSIPLINNLVSSTTASTSRPDKLNLTPPRQTFDHFGGNNSDDSDGGFDSRSASRAGDSKGDGNIRPVGMLNWSHHNGYEDQTASSSGSSSSSIAANLSASYNSDSRNQNCMGGGQYGGSLGGGGYGDYSPHMDPINM